MSEQTSVAPCCVSGRMSHLLLSIETNRQTSTKESPLETSRPSTDCEHTSPTQKKHRPGNKIPLFSWVISLVSI